MPRLSACIIAADEEDRIGDCLDSVSFADEVLVVDAHSRDRTREIAAARGARVIERDWPGHVRQKEFAARAAAHDWILSLDADERVSPELKQSIRQAMTAEPPACAAYRMARLSFHLGRWIRHGGWYPDWKVRLFDRRRCRWGGADPHDRVETDPGAPVGTLAGDLRHLVYRDLADHLRTVNSYSSIAAAGLLERGRKRAWPGLIFHPPFRFLRAYLLQAGFLDGLPGLVNAVLGATQAFLKYAKLAELRRARAAGAPPPAGKKQP